MLETAFKKSGPELLKVDLDNKDTMLSKKRVFIGQAASEMIRDMDLKPDFHHLDWFLSAVFKYHRTVAVKLIGYFQTGLTSTDLDYMSSLAQENRTSLASSYKLKFLAKSISKVVENIRPGDGMDKLTLEIDMYTVDDDLLEDVIQTKEMKYEDY